METPGSHVKAMQNASYRAQVLMAFSAFQMVDGICLHIPKDLPPFQRTYLMVATKMRAQIQRHPIQRLIRGIKMAQYNLTPDCSIPTTDAGLS